MLILFNAGAKILLDARRGLILPSGNLLDFHDIIWLLEAMKE